MKKYRIKDIKNNVNQVIKKYKHDQVFIKNYGDEVIKISILKTVRNKDYKEAANPRVKKGSRNKSKIGCNIRRAKARVQELTLCNKWEWFATFTISPKQYDRTNLKKWYKDLTQWFRNYNKKFGIKIRYLLIPELHADGVSWHMHGLLMGLPEGHLTQLKRGDGMSKSQLEKVENGAVVYVWVAYEKKFGYCSVEPIHNKIAVGKYISKSIDLSAKKGVTEVNAHLYYSSKGLIGAETIKVGSLNQELWRKEDYGNEYCKVLWEPYSQKILTQIVGSIDNETTDMTQRKRE